MNTDDMLTVTQAAGILGISRQGCHYLIKAESIPVYRAGPVFLVSRKRIDQLAARRVKRQAEKKKREKPESQPSTA